MLNKKIDFAVIFTVKNANPNGDPLNGNRPRTTLDGNGEISDVCIKRKIRDRLMENKKLKIFIQSDDRRTDEYPTLKTRMDSELKGIKDKEDAAKKACETWFDVRAFGQVLAFAGDKKGEGVSIPVRGPVSIQGAYTAVPVDVTSLQITKSVSSDGDGTKKSSDTMGMKHRVDFGAYCFSGSINTQLSEKTGFSDEDAAILKEILPKLFENDASSARPEGSMKVEKVFWWTHSSKKGDVSSAKVHGTLKMNPDGTYVLADTPSGVTLEIIDGF